MNRGETAKQTVLSGRARRMTAATVFTIRSGTFRLVGLVSARRPKESCAPARLRSCRPCTDRSDTCPGDVALPSADLHTIDLSQHERKRECMIVSVPDRKRKYK